MRNALLIFWLCAVAAQAHDVITTAITFNRDISRILYDRCAACHHPGGRAFSLLTYAEARPWAVALKEEVLRRRMPPWGAVKGFGDFRNDQGLSGEQLERIVSWVDGGVPEGKESDLPPVPKFTKDPVTRQVKGELVINGDFTFIRPFVLDGIVPRSVPDKTEMQVIAELPDGSVEPLLWLNEYKAAFSHPFLYREPRRLPVGTVIRGVPAGSSVALLPVKK